MYFHIQLTIRAHSKISQYERMHDPAVFQVSNSNKFGRQVHKFHVLSEHGTGGVSVHGRM